MLRKYLSFVTVTAMLFVSLFSLMAPTTASAATLVGSSAGGLQTLSTQRKPVTFQTTSVATTTTVRKTTTTACTTTTTRRADAPTLITTTPAVIGQFKKLDPSQYYGRQLLAKSDNPDLLVAYERMVAKMDNPFSRMVTFTDLKLTFDETVQVVRYFKDDYPQAFWLPMSFEVRNLAGVGLHFGGSGTGYYITYDLYTTDAETYKRDKMSLDVAVQAFLQEFSPLMSEYELALAIHDKLCAMATYDYSKPTKTHSSDLLGVLLYGTGQCESYARAYQYLLYCCGIQCIDVYGTASTGDHIWNMVKVDGRWMMVDCTVDSKPDGVRHTWFDFTYEDIAPYIDIWTGNGFYPLPNYPKA